MSEIRIAIPDLDLNNALRLDGNLRNYEIGPFEISILTTLIVSSLKKY